MSTDLTGIEDARAAGRGLAQRDVGPALARAREATLRLVEPLTDDELSAQISPLMSPLVWDLAHIAWFEELWLARRVGGAAPTDEQFDDLYDAFRHVRDERSTLPILSPREARAYLIDVRSRVIARLDDRDPESADPLLAGDCVYGLVVEHELQHQETMLQTLQLSGLVLPSPLHDDRRAAPEPEELFIPAGPFPCGSRGDPWAYDNECPSCVIELAAFLIERFPVTNERFARFIEDGGYRRRDLWTDGGWAWREKEGAEAPLYWERAGDGWLRRRFGRLEHVPPAEPVQHISFHEAEAVAAWAGKRLPTEYEWEKAAQGTDPADPTANLGRASFGPQTVAARASSDAGCGCVLGDVWEWTASPFAGYPGFRAFPYPEYSEVFFDDAYRVLRGGSWATDPLVARTSFRNWDYPQRRQIFSGVRLASDA